MAYRSPSTPQLILGVMIIAVGVLFLLDNLGYLYAGDYLQYWPLLLVAYGVAKVASPSGRGWGAFVGLVGILLLLRNLDVMYFRIWDFWPVLLIFLGGLMLYRGVLRPGGRGGSGGATSGENTLQGFALLGGFKRASTSQSFEGGQLTAILGGCEVDLSGANIRGDSVVLDVLTFMGGIELRVPDTWRVELQGTPVLGGFEDKTRPPAGANPKVLVVKGYAMFGGVEIKN